MAVTKRFNSDMISKSTEALRRYTYSICVQKTISSSIPTVCTGLEFVLGT